MFIFVKIYFQVLKFLNKPSREEKALRKDKQNLKNEQNSINITENFAKHSKLQRKINAIDGKLNDLQSNRSNVTLQFAVTYGLKVLIGLIILFCSIYFRNIPVFKIDEKISLLPFDHIISFPNEKNTVSFHFWVLCCTTVFRLIKL